MPAREMSFEPYVDFDALTPEMAAAVRDSVAEYRSAMEALTAAPEATPELAATMLRASERASRVVREIVDELHVMPMMVHVAGERREETNPDNSEEQAVIQRCTRCGSILHLWSERMGVMDPEVGPRPLELEEIPWWSLGARIAKANSDNGPIEMYEIDPPERELLAHEHVCADLSSLELRP